jgi:hypothetical protein
MLKVLLKIYYTQNVVKACKSLISSGLPYVYTTISIDQDGRVLTIFIHFLFLSENVDSSASMTIGTMTLSIMCQATDVSYGRQLFKNCVY